MARLLVNTYEARDIKRILDSVTWSYKECYVGNGYSKGKNVSYCNGYRKAI